MFGGMRERNGVRRYILPPLYPGPLRAVYLFFAYQKRGDLELPVLLIGQSRAPGLGPRVP